MKRQHLMTIGGAIVAALLLVVGGSLAITGHLPFRGDDDGTRLEQAVALAPPDSQRLSWTDWAGVRERLGTDDLADLLDRGFDADVTSTSALVSSAPDLERSFGFSPATLEWELFAQSDDGAAVIMQLPARDIGGVADALRALGFTPPTHDTGIWDGGSEVVAKAGDVTPELQYFSLDAERGLILTSDTLQGLRQALENSGADDEHGPDVDQVVHAIGSPLSASIATGDQACNALAMGRADAADQSAAADLIAQAGRVDPLTGFAIAERTDGGVVVAMSFTDAATARTNADTRAMLASGAAPGQGGDFADRFTLGRVQADGEVVTMRLQPNPGAYVLSDLSSGPVLFATC